MTHPSERLKELLREQPEEASVERTWKSIERARHGGGASSQRRGFALVASTAVFFIATTALGMGAWKVWRAATLPDASDVTQTPNVASQTPGTRRTPRASTQTNPPPIEPQQVVPNVVPVVAPETLPTTPSPETAPRVRAPRETTTTTPAPALEAPRSSPSELLASADDARLAGRPLDAVTSLEQLLAEHASSREAPLAAVSLGRIELDVLRRPARAAAAYARALAIGVPRELDENVRYRLAIAYDRAGLHNDASRAVRSYLEAYPTGAHADDVRRLGEVR